MGILDMIRRHEESGTRKFYGAILDDHVDDKSYSASVFNKDKNYFSIRLCEMFLKNKANYISGFIPMAVALNMFNYAGKQHEIPVLVGNQMLHAVDKYIQNQDIEFKNVPVIGPIPYTGADVGLFIGLYRVQVDNLAKSLFGVVDNLINAFNLSDLTSYLTIANRIGEGLATLIGLPQIEMRFGTMDTFGGNDNPLRDRYLLFINCPEEQVDPDKLWVHHGRLLEGETIQGAAAFSRHDYCLVRIEKLDGHPDICKLPFHGLFIESKTRIWENNVPEAERLFLTLMRDVATSPDLTAEDRGALMKTYMANYHQEKENHAAVTGSLSRGGASTTRSAERGARSSSTLPARIAIQRVASMAKKVPLEEKSKQAVAHDLLKLTQYWEAIPHLGSRKQAIELDAAKLSRQFDVIKKENAKAPLIDPSVLSDVISYTAFQ